MPSLTEWKVPPAYQPRPGDYGFDLDRVLSSVVGLHSIIHAAAFSAAYRRYCWPTDGLDGIRFAPFQLLATDGAAYGDRPISSLVEAGRGGLPQDPEATLPALYIADRDFNPNPQAGIDKTEASSTPLQTTVRLAMRCG